MHIIRLKLENTKSHAAAEFSFTDGINAIVGQNGAGKSTLLEAIGFALFDYMAYSQKDFIREGEKNAIITVTIGSSVDNRQYEIVRRIGGAGQYYVYDPEIDARICEGGSDVKAFLKEHMRVDQNASLETLFNDAVGVPQGTLTAAFALTAARRRGTFDKLLQVEEYETASKKLMEPQKVLREQLKEFDLKVTELQTRLERLPNLGDASKARQKKIQQAEKEVQKVSKSLDTLLDKRIKLDAIQQEITTSEREVARLTQQAKSIQAQHESAQKALKESEQAQKVVQQNQAGFDAYSAAQIQQKEVNAKQQERQKLNAACNQIERSLAESQSQLSVLLQQLEEIEAASLLVQKLEPRVKEQIILEEKLAKFQRHSMQLTEVRRVATELQKRSQEIQAQKKNLLSQQSKAEKLHEEREQAEAMLKEAREVLIHCQEEMARIKVEGDTFNKQTGLLKDANTQTCPVCEQELTAAHRSSMLERNEQNVVILRNSYAIKKTAQSDAEARIQTIEKQIRAFGQQLQQLPRPEEIQRLDKQAADLSNSLKESETEIEQLAKKVSAGEQVSKDLAELGNPKQEMAIARQKVENQASLEQKRAQTKTTVDTQQKELRARQKEQIQFDDLDEVIESILAKLQQHEDAYQAVLANRNGASALQNRQSIVKEVETEQKENVKLQKAATKGLEKLEKKFDQEKYQEYLDKERALRNQQATVQAQIDLLTEEDVRGQQEIETLLKYQLQLDDIQQKRQKVEKKLDTLDMVRKILRQAGPHITRALIHQVSNGAEQIFGDLMQDYSRRLAWNEDYGITLEVDGRERQFVQLSGGEQMSAALSVRLALLREMSSIDVAFFDEPTTNLDEMRRESLAKQILQVKGFRQLFVISHDDTFEQSTENIIRVERP